LYTLKIFTALTGREDLYKQNGTDLLEKINAIIGKASNQEAPEVLLLLASSKTISVRLPNTSTGQMLEQLGAKNIAGDSRLSEADRQIFSMERIIQKNPDFIFVQAMGDVAKVEERLKADIESNPAWNSLDAVKNNRYIVLDKELYHFKANTRYAEAYEKLAKMLYPDLFN
jgi:iron complex transport system substrate-binding protein